MELRMYAVLACRDTGHGAVTSLVLVTDSIMYAINSARGCERLGYEFYSKDTGAWVVLIQTDMEYRQDSNQPILYSRILREKGWEETWESEKFRESVEG